MFWEVLSKLPVKEGLVATLSWLINGSPILLRFATIIFLLLSVGLASIVWIDSSQTTSLMMNALASPLEAAHRPDTGLEALLMATVVKIPSQSGDSQPTTFGSEFVNDLAKIQNQVLASTAGETKDIDLTTLKANDRNSPYNWMASDDSDGFLFVSGPLVSTLSKNFGSAAPLPYKLKSEENPQLYRDVLASQRVAEFLCKTMPARYDPGSAGHVSLFGSGPLKVNPATYRQSYIIFSSDVTRICDTSQANDASQQSKYYVEMFSPETRLSTQPYFEETVKTKGKSNEYWTTPYIDLAGHGVIKTYCRYLQAEKEDAVVCFDFPLGGRIEGEIAHQASLFGGSTSILDCGDRCTIPQDGEIKPRLLDRIIHPPSHLTREEVDRISEIYDAHRNTHTQSQFLGRISTLNSTNDSEGTIWIVPTRDRGVLAIKVNLNNYQWWRIFWVCSAAACVAFTIVLIVLLFADYGLKVNEQQRAFDAVDRVMSDVPAAYARVDENGKFVRINDPLANLFGYKSAEEALPTLRGLMFEDFLDRDSLSVYADIKRKRQAGETSTSYAVQVFTGGGPGKEPLRWVKAHGGDVPTPKAARNKPGESFGILLPSDPPRPIPLETPSKSGT